MSQGPGFSVSTSTTTNVTLAPNSFLNLSLQVLLAFRIARQMTAYFGLDVSRIMLPHEFAQTRLHAATAAGELDLVPDHLVVRRDPGRAVPRSFCLWMGWRLCPHLVAVSQHV